MVLELEHGIIHQRIIVAFDANIPSGMDKELQHLNPAIQFYYPSKINRYNPERGRSPLRMNDFELFTYILQVFRDDYPNHRPVFVTLDKRFEKQIETHSDRNAMSIICLDQINDRRIFAQRLEEKLNRVLIEMTSKN